MSIAKPEKKTPREWSREWLSRADAAGAEASASEVVEVVVTEAVAYERERCAKLVEGTGLGRNCNPKCHKAAAARIRES